MKQHLIYISVIAALLVVIGLNRCSNQQVRTETEVTTDSTVVDSLEEHIEYLESIPPDTVEKKVIIEEPTETGEKSEEGYPIREYTSSHVGSEFSFHWKTIVAGKMIDQDFSYIRKARLVRETIRTKIVHSFTTVETTNTIQPSGYLALGGAVGFNSSNLLYEVEVEYHSSDGYTYQYKYIPRIDGHLIGVTIPIRLKSIF